MGIKRKKYRRHSSSAALYIPIAVLLIMFSTVFGTSAFLKVTEIEIIGASRYTQEEIIRIAAIVTGDNILFIDTIDAGRRITAALPYVSDAKVVRKLPDTICIEIWESTPVAVVSAQGSMWIIDSTGRILERTNSTPENLIVVNGVTPIEPAEGSRIKVEESAETRLAYMKDALTAIENAGLEDKASFLDVTYITNISFVYDGRIKVVLGGPDDLAYKLGRLEDAISGIPDPDRAVGTLDLSEQNRAHWRPE